MGEKEGKKGDGEKKGIELKVDLHCQGCADRVNRAIKSSFQGVDKISVDSSHTKLMIMGNVDPLKLKEFIESKTKKKVDFISPSDTKEDKKKNEEQHKSHDKVKSDDKKPKDKSNDKKAKDKSDDKKEKDKSDDKKEKDKSDDKKKQQTVSLKIRLHCDGCIDRIQRNIYKIKGVDEVTVDKDKNVVTVKGTMDVKSMANKLQSKFKRTVEIMKDDKSTSDGGEKEKIKPEKNKEEIKQDKNKQKEKEDKATTSAVPEPEINKMEHRGFGSVNGYQHLPANGYVNGFVHEGEHVPVNANAYQHLPVNGYTNGYEQGYAVNGYTNGYANEQGYAVNGYTNGYTNEQGYAANGYTNGYANDRGYAYDNFGYRMDMAHAPQMFSDENPNACSIM